LQEKIKHHEMALSSASSLWITIVVSYFKLYMQLFVGQHLFNSAIY